MLWDWVMGTFRPHPQDPGSIESRRKPAARCKLQAEHSHEADMPVVGTKEKIG
jgi:hypothetical protein